MIKMQDVSFKYYGSKQGVFNIDLTVKDGECVAITGESGCGKTTVTRLINGLAPNYYSGIKTGNININENDISKLPMYDIGKMVGSIFQDPRRQFFSSELQGEVAFACENYGFLREEIRERTDNAIAKMDLEYLRNTALDVLSSGEKQRAAIASVYALYPSVFVFDEPTSNMDLSGIMKLKDIMSMLKAAGHTLLISEHRLDWLFDICDRYIYMKNGRVICEYTSKEFIEMGKNERIEKGLRYKPESRIDKIPSPDIGSTAAIRAEGISCKINKKQILRDLHIHINEKSITALTGKNGRGKTTLALALSGLIPVQSGNIYIENKKVRRGINRLVYYCSNDTGTQFFTSSVSKELLLDSDYSESSLEKARYLLKTLNLYEYKDVHPAAMSGGQRQRLAVCCALLSRKNILILDEPTSGLDGRNMLLIAEELKKAVKSGKTILVITHDEELIEYCDYRINMDKAVSGLI